MTTKKAIKILKHHNIWRRGKTDNPKYRPKDIGLAIDKAVEVMEKQVCKNCGEPCILTPKRSDAGFVVMNREANKAKNAYIQPMENRISTIEIGEVVSIDEMEERDFVIEYVIFHGVDMYKAETEIEQIRELWRLINR